MKPKSQSILAVEMNFGSDLETAREIVRGVDEFISLLKSAYDAGAARRRSGSFAGLLLLVEQSLSIDNALPFGLRLALRATIGEDWKKPLQRLKRAIAAWNPNDDEALQRPALVIGDREEALKLWDEEEALIRNSDASIKEQKGFDAITDDLSSLFQMLAQMSQAAEQRLIGRTSPRSPPKRDRDEPRLYADKRLTEEYLRLQWLVEFLKHGIENGDKAALRLAKQHFGRNTLADRLNLARGTVSESKVYGRIKAELQLDRNLGTLTRTGFDPAAEEQAILEDISDEARLLLDRLDRYLKNKQISPEMCDALRTMIVKRDDLHDKIELEFDKVDRGEKPFG